PASAPAAAPGACRPPRAPHVVNRSGHGPGPSPPPRLRVQPPVRLIAPGRVYGTSAEYGRGRQLAIILACSLALGSAAGLAGGLASGDASPPAEEQSRRLSATEAGRLAT